MSDNITEKLELFDEGDAFELADISFTSSEEEGKEEKEIITNIKAEDLMQSDEEEDEEDEGQEGEDDESLDDEDITDEDEESDTDEGDEVKRIKALKELGYLLLPDDYKGESLEQALKDSENNRSYVALQKILNIIPEQEIEGYGSAKELFSAIVTQGIDNIEVLKKSDELTKLERIDLSKEDDQKEVMRMFYKLKGFSNSKAEKYIERAEDSAELAEEAKDAFDAIKEDVTKKKQATLAQEQAAKAQKEQAEIESFNNLKSTLQTNENFGGYKILANDKEKALVSLYRPVTTSTGTTMTEFDYRLNEVVLKDPKLTLALSDMLNRITKDKSGNFSFDFSNIEKSTTTKATKDFKKAVDSLTNSQGKGKVKGRRRTSEPEFDWNSVL